MHACMHACMGRAFVPLVLSSDTVFAHHDCPSSTCQEEGGLTGKQCASRRATGAAWQRRGHRGGHGEGG